MADLLTMLKQLRVDEPNHPYNANVISMFIRELNKQGVNVNDINIVVGDENVPKAAPPPRDQPCQVCPYQGQTWRTDENQETWDEFVEAMRVKEAEIDRDIARRRSTLEDMLQMAQGIYDDYVKRGKEAYEILKAGGTVQPIYKVVPPRKDVFNRGDATIKKPLPKSVPFYMRPKPNKGG